MSQFPPPSFSQPTRFDGPGPGPTAQGNTMGLVGFILSLVGLLSCGLLCPVGLVLSIIGLKREPRGLAVAGTVIGGIGSLGIVIGVLFFGAMIAACGGAIAAGGGFKSFSDMLVIQQEVERYQSANGTLPSAMNQLTGVPQASLTDSWGTPYILTLSADGKSLELRSAGADKAMNTTDDLKFDLKD